jgi:hypothetical protein
MTIAINAKGRLPERKKEDRHETISEGTFVQENYQFVNIKNFVLKQLIIDT